MIDMESIDQIILGDNQFFGVNHMSQDKGKITEEKFRDINEIKKLLYIALDNGVKGVMFSTHPAIYQITDVIRSDDVLKKELNIYVNLPYIVKYVSMVNEMGLYRTLNTILKGQSIPQRIRYILSSLYSVSTNDYMGIINRLIDAEMNPFHNLNVRAVFLHNVLADLALGYKMADVVKNFDNYIKDKYDCQPAYGTLNFPAFANFLNQCGIEKSLIMTSVNKKGFLMNPSREASELAIQNSSHTVLAMATLASGSIPPEEAYEYLFSLENIKHVVVGLSSRKHAEQTFKLIRSHMKAY